MCEIEELLSRALFSEPIDKNKCCLHCWETSYPLCKGSCGFIAMNSRCREQSCGRDPPGHTHVRVEGGRDQILLMK